MVEQHCTATLLLLCALHSRRSTACMGGRSMSVKFMVGCAVLWCGTTSQDNIAWVPSDDFEDPVPELDPTYYEGGEEGRDELDDLSDDVGGCYY